MPSVSSRGFDLTAEGLSESSKDLEIAQDRLTEALLISAYDLHHQLLPDNDKFFTADHWSTVYAIPQLLIIDSGGYELRSGPNSKGVLRDTAAAQDFSRTDYDNVATQLPRDRDLMLVTYDYVPEHDSPTYGEQAQEATRLLDQHPQWMVDFLAKPQAQDQFISPSDLASAIKSVNGLDVVGVTDKELGDSILDRLTTIADLRWALDAAGVAAPLHVFGVLSPLHIGLYFMAGAEIFDGLDWIRYGHHNGMAVERETAALLKGWTQEPRYRRQALITLDYLDALAEQKRVLSEWAQNGGDFSLMEHWQHVYEATYTAMMEQLRAEG